MHLIGVKTVHFGGQAIRFVTHLDFDDSQLASFHDISRKISLV